MWNCYYIIHVQIFIQILLLFIYNMILYSIQRQASYHGNWSCHAIIKNSHSMTCLLLLASITTESVIIIHTKARSYKCWRYSYKTAHAKKVELEYLADLWPCARCLIFKLHFSCLLNRCLRAVYMMEGGMILDVFE